MTREDRIARLERISGSKKEQEPVWLFVLYDGGEPCEAALEAAKERAMAEYKASHPDWAQRKFNVMYVVDAETKELLEKVRSGELETHTGRVTSGEL